MNVNECSDVNIKSNICNTDCCISIYRLKMLFILSDM